MASVSVSVFVSVSALCPLLSLSTVFRFGYHYKRSSRTGSKSHSAGRPSSSKNSLVCVCMRACVCARACYLNGQKNIRKCCNKPQCRTTRLNARTELQNVFDQHTMDIFQDVVHVWTGVSLF